MKFFFRFWILVSLCASLAAAKPPRLETHGRWANSLLLKGGDRELVIAPDAAGRIVSYSLRGQNILFESERGGGYQCDIGPELARIPDHPILWKQAYRWESLGERGVRLISQVDTNLGIQLEKEILMDPKTGEVGITQTLRNASQQALTNCLWDRTLCRGGGYAFFPLGKKSRFPAGWSQRRTMEGRFVYDGQGPDSPKVRIMDGVLVAKAEGPATKVGADSEVGWIAYVLGDLLLVKFFPCTLGQPYTDGGNSVELYFDERVAELEPLSATALVFPNRIITLPEKWLLRKLPKEVKSYEEARALVKTIPENPFSQ